MTDNTEVRREELALVLNEFIQNPDISEWPNEMVQVLMGLHAGISDFLSDVKDDKGNGIDTNEKRAKTLLERLQLNKGNDGKPSTSELSTSVLLQRKIPYQSFRVLLRLHNVPNTQITVHDIVNTKTTIEDVLIAHSLKPGTVPGNDIIGWLPSTDKPPTLKMAVVEEIANELDVDDPVELRKSVYRQRSKIYSLPEFWACVRIHSSEVLPSNIPE